MTQNSKDINSNVFISNGELEKKDLIAQAKGLISKVKHFNNKELLLEHLTIEAADHGKAFPMTVIKSMYWLTKILNE